MSKNPIAFVADGQIPASPPPSNAVGPVKWMKDNLFSGAVNSILTIMALFVVFALAYEILPWLINSSWFPEEMSLKGCRAEAEGACFAVLVERRWQFVFGFYPPELYWRPTLAFILLIVALAPVLVERAPRQLLAL
ncbi:amino acid ABC transporter permease, partial [Paracoccaceae bacterium]|nr:amino acid ABC transporter permease [Paracoccaceae bacterium]